MKYTIYILAILLIFSCQKDSIPEVQKACIEIEYNSSFTALMGDEICLPDGSSFTIKNIKDETCPCESNCKWEGELKVIVEMTNLVGEKSTFGFGSTTYKLRPFFFENSYIQSFTYDYEFGSLPDCINEFDAQKITLELTVSQ